MDYNYDPNFDLDEYLDSLEDIGQPPPKRPRTSAQSGERKFNAIRFFFQEPATSPYDGPPLDSLKGIVDDRDETRNNIPKLLGEATSFVGEKTIFFRWLSDEGFKSLEGELRGKLRTEVYQNKLEHEGQVYIVFSATARSSRKGTQDCQWKNNYAELFCVAKDGDVETLKDENALSRGKPVKMKAKQKEELFSKCERFVLCVWSNYPCPESSKWKLCDGKSVSLKEKNVIDGNLLLNCRCPSACFKNGQCTLCGKSPPPVPVSRQMMYLRMSSWKDCASMQVANRWKVYPLKKSFNSSLQGVNFALDTFKGPSPSYQAVVFFPDDGSVLVAQDMDDRKLINGLHRPTFRSWKTTLFISRDPKQLLMTENFLRDGIERGESFLDLLAPAGIGYVEFADTWGPVSVVPYFFKGGREKKEKLLKALNANADRFPNHRYQNYQCLPLDLLATTGQKIPAGANASLLQKVTYDNKEYILWDENQMRLETFRKLM